MADNNIMNTIGRFQLVDPNKFQNQSSTGLFGDPNYNISVPNEDLSIIVELVTQTKNRTLLNTNKNTNTAISTDNKSININFIDGSKNQSTGGKDFLTTSYTDMFTEMKDVEEAFGITSIDIDFNSSYAPMVNINFIDIKGAGLFQMGAKSKYSVLFRLPYPIFELTVKGFYGKPVKYCLHMLKCNTKFNSSSGNFEIAAQFVGYSYAMLSDMLLGYIKAAALTPAGAELLKARGIISIKDFMKKLGDINTDLPTKVLTDSDEDVHNLSTLEDIKKDLASMKSLIYDTITTINAGKNAVIKVPDTNYNGVTLSRTIAIFPDPDPQAVGFNDTDNQTIKQNYNTKILEKLRAYNIKVDAIDDLKIIDSDGKMQCINILLAGYEYFSTYLEQLKGIIKTEYSTQSDAETEEILNRLKSAAANATNTTILFQFYDVTDALIIINNVEKKIKILQDELTKTVGEKLKTYITNELGFDTSIRSIVRLFTVHIEIFLEQLFNVSNQYNDTARKDELKKFTNAEGSKQIDVNQKDAVKGIIYPWPEYQENGVEKYLGSKSGPLNNPLNVPEIKFTEELYEAMKKQLAAEDDLNKLEEKAKPIWLSFNPIDSWYFNQTETNPYGRLPDSATHDDFARLAVLRAVGYMGFSNKFLSGPEITAFAQQEAALLIDKLKDDTDGKIIKALNLNYSSQGLYAAVSGVITDADAANLNTTVVVPTIVNIGGTKIPYYKYHYIYPDTLGTLELLPPESSGYTFARLSLPVAKDFANADYKGENEFKHGYTLSNATGDDYKTKTNKDGVAYIHILTKEEYEGPANIRLPGTQTPKTFDVAALAKEMTGYADLEAAGFVSNNGKYGVQEFLKIDHVGTKDAPFFTLFYNRGNQNAGIYPWYVSPTLCRPRGTGITATTQFDITSSNIIKLPTTTVESTTMEYLMTTKGYLKINEIYNKRKDIYENIPLAKEYSVTRTNVSCPFFNFNVWYKDNDNLSTVVNINLFGSRFYNAQTLEGKAFLFLHCFPWKGLTGGAGEDGGPFGIQEILNTFINRTGFIQVPKYFPAFLGGVLKRARVAEILKFDVVVSGNTEQLLPGFDNGYFGNNLPNIDEYLVNNSSNFVGPMTFYPDSVLVGTGYMKITDVLKYLPYEAKQTLIKEFDNFAIAGGEYDTMRTSFEIYPVGYTGDGDDASWTKAFDNINKGVMISNNQQNVEVELTTIEANLKLANQKSFRDTFNVFSFLPNQYFTIDESYDKLKYNYFIEYKDGSDPETKLRDAIISYKYLSNESIFIWGERPKRITDYVIMSSVRENYTKNILISEADWKLYFAEFLNLISTKVSKIEENKKFLTTDQEEIKFEIYRNLKKIYDKWIAFSDTKEKIMFQCCARGTNTPDRLSGDTKLQEHRGGTQLELIDSFRFVDSFFRDIGDKFNINPFVVSQMLHETTNTNFYSFLSRILTDNNFDFVALPTFIDYNKPSEVLDMFKPYPYYEAKNIVAPSGPSFVCVYVGQTSTKLDFGEDPTSQYPNDGFDLTKDCLNCPEGVKGDSNGKGEWEDVAAAFIVRYGQQNQNYFKDISLDQAEFGATAESLEITDALSNTLSDSNKSFYGQNLYDVYSVRSYKVEVEMMGDAMIQPMMYFQLDNMPMFHGAYLITHVKHSIKPHFMSTIFNGTRIKGTQTPLIDAASLYGALLGTFALPTSSGVLTETTSGAYPPIILTIKENGGGNGNIEQGKITRTKIDLPAGIKNNIDDKNPVSKINKEKILTEAVAPLKAMLTAWVDWMIKSGFKGNNGIYAGINSGFRTIQEQEATKAIYGESAAKVGRSPHGWGIAIDLQYYDRNGNQISNFVTVDGKLVRNNSVGYNYNINESIIWLLDHSYKYGFIIPPGLRDNFGLEEFWHWEYHGRSAKCILGDNTIIKGHKTDTTKDYEDIVTNPPKPDGTIPIYTDCVYRRLNQVDGGSNAETNNTLLWLYLSWQQGPEGSIEHYKIANGSMLSYKIGEKNITKNWPDGAISDNNVRASDIPTLYRNDPRKLANAFINVWGKTISKKSSEALSLINSSAKNRLGVPYLSLKDIFKKYEKPKDNLTWENLAAMGYIENGLFSDTPDTGAESTYQGMFQMNRTFAEFKPILSGAYKGVSTYIDKDNNKYNDYDVDKITQGFVSLILSSFNGFKKATGFNPATSSTVSSAPSTSLQSTNKTSIIIGDSMSENIQTNVISSSGKARLIGPSGPDSLWKSDIATPWLTAALKKYPVSKNVTNVIVTMGANDGYITSTNIAGLVTEMRAKFPSAKYYVVQGTWGWGGAKYKTVNNKQVELTEADIDAYYAIWKNLGVILLQPKLGKVATDAEAHKNTDACKAVGKAIAAAGA